MNKMNNKLLQARIKLFNSIKYYENLDGFNHENFLKWRGSKKNKETVKTLAGDDSFEYEQVAEEMLALYNYNKIYESVNLQNNKNKSEWLVVLKNLIKKQQEEINTIPTPRRKNSKTQESAKNSTPNKNKQINSSNEEIEPTLKKKLFKKTDDSDEDLSDSCDSESDENSNSQDESDDTQDKEPNTETDTLTLLIQALAKSNSGSVPIDALKNDKQDVEDWFDYFDRAAKGNGWDKCIKGAKLPLYLKGEAEYIWKQMKKVDQYNYFEVRKNLLEKLQSDDKRLEAASKFFSITQREDQAVIDFARRLKKLAKQSGRLNNKDIIGRLRSAMHKEIALATITVQTKSLSKFIKSCKAAETCLQSKQHQNISAVQGRDTYNSYSNTQTNNSTEQRVSNNIQNLRRCFVCQSSEHLKNNCPIWQERMQKIANYYCTKCHNKGHSRNYCKAK